jgi:hypothetical protein
MKKPGYSLSIAAGMFALMVLSVPHTLSAGEPSPSKTPTVQQLAKEIRAQLGDGHQSLKFTSWLAGIWGDTVVITHDPRAANDGPIDGRKLGAGEIAVFTQLLKVIPDFHQEKLQVRVVGDAIEFHEEIVGTLPDGSVDRVPIQYRFSVDKGHIVAVHGTFNRAKLAAFSEVVKKAGLRTPE